MILCIGEALVDVRDGKRTVGGGPFNTALSCARLGGAVTFLGCVSSDADGSMILEKAIDNCILFEPRFCASPLPTMNATCGFDEKGSAKYSFTKGMTTATAITAEGLEESVSQITDSYCVLTGSLAMADKTSRGNIASWLESRKDVFWLVYDPNVRPDAIDDMESFRSFFESFCPSCDIVKASADDISCLYPDMPFEEACAHVLSLCRRHLVVTCGEEGSTWYDRSCLQSAVFCPAVKAEKVVDTIGCGDTYTGALLVWLQKNGFLGKRGKDCELELSLEDKALAMDLASNASCVNASREGCDPPVFDILCE